MSDLGPPTVSPPRQTEGVLYRDVVDVAFEVLREDLTSERKMLKQKWKRNVPRLQRVEPIPNGLDGSESLRYRLAQLTRLLGGLERLKAAYRLKFGVGVGGQYVPLRRRTWTPEDKQKVFYHLTKIIHDADLADAVYDDEHLLRELWEDGRFPTVEHLCDDPDDVSASRSEDVERLLAARVLRRASAAARLRTSQRLISARRRRSVASDLVEQGGRKLRSTNRRGPSVRPGQT